MNNVHPIFDGVLSSLSPTSAAQARTLTAIHDSLFAPRFRALEEYGAAPKPAPTAAKVIEDATATLKWHADKEAELASELASRRAAARPNDALIDECAKALAFHRAEQERIREIVKGIAP